MRQLLIVFAVLLVLAVLAATVGIFVSLGRAGVAAPTVLSWRLDAPLLDYSEAPTLDLLRRRSPHGLARVYRLLTRARRDDKIKGLALYIQDAWFGFGKAQELRALLASFAGSGRFVDCYLETAGEGSNGTLAYYLASACQRITLSPLGEMNTVGLYADSPFVRGTLDKLRIDPQFLHVGEYKSAAEFYTERQHSAASEAALSAVLDDLFEQVVVGVAEARELSPDRVRQLIDRAPLTAEQALEAGLIDEIAYPDIFEERLRDRAEGEPAILPFGEYRVAPVALAKRRVAVVFAQGTIVRGWNGTDPWSQQRYVGAESLREILRQLRDEPGVLGVVLRVDSPGGSPVASDMILREAELFARHKPLVVSMSDVAASGGYYISAKAHRIVAEPATITGSIGVVGGKLTTRRFQEELLGISHHALSRGANADFFSNLDPFSPAQVEHFQGLMERVYEAFIDHVAEGRQMSREAVEKVAGGRIWTGRQAQQMGLVDEIGGIDKAVELVLEAAGHDPDTPVELDFYPRAPSLLQLLTRGLAPFLEAAERGRQPALPSLRSPHALQLPGEIERLFRPH